MADISFPAHITVARETDIDGLPILDAEITVSDDIAALELPPGPAGEQGRPGRPGTTFRKMGEIANAAARPGGLGAEQRGHWWHRLDDDGMDVWTGASWQHSPAAVGAKGPVADALSVITVTTPPDERLTAPAVQIESVGGVQRITVNAPAGPRGPEGPPGESGPIVGGSDYDSSSGPSHGGVFAYNRAGGKFVPAPAPLGAGPWSWYETGFVETTEVTASRLTVATFTIPAQPFAWRPIVYGHLYVGAAVTASNYGQGTVRLHNAQGQVLATTLPVAGPRTICLPLIPTYSEEQATRNMSPTSTYATVAAGQSANLVVSVERSQNGAGAISFNNSRSSLVVYARPI
ncbi:hypothetical protein [Nocardia sp. AG03]|uniref:hypothetical protein n=1 Tax=Nocardia sp. AG03 TaxID=3025312 RepID=UPI002418A4C9|nr:hypothetical protein [Nocardia sp. AG03]